MRGGRAHTPRVPADPQHELKSLRSEVRKLTDALELAKGELALALDEIKRKERINSWPPTAVLRIEFREA
jgi:hypothetical protein